MEKITKDEILAKLAAKRSEELLDMLERERIDHNEMIANLAKLREEELTYKYTNRKRLLSEGNSYSKVENILRTDERLYHLKKSILGVAALKKQKENRIEVIKNYYWGNRKVGG